MPFGSVACTFVLPVPHKAEVGGYLSDVDLNKLLSGEQREDVMGPGLPVLQCPSQRLRKKGLKKKAPSLHSVVFT